MLGSTSFVSDVFDVLTFFGCAWYFAWILIIAISRGHEKVTLKGILSEFCWKGALPKRLQRYLSDGSANEGEAHQRDSRGMNKE